MSNTRPYVIGIGGCARAGKDTFASILIHRLESIGKTTKRIALADPLKRDFDIFCKVNFGFSAFTQIQSQKKLIRPALVWYGDAQRQLTNGRHWIDLAQREINDADADFVLVTDVRYAHYEKDEMYWLKNECNGLLIHVSQYTVDGNLRRFVPPANEHEAENDPKVKANADLVIEWENVGTMSGPSFLLNDRLNAHVDLAMNLLREKL